MMKSTVKPPLHGQKKTIQENNALTASKGPFFKDFQGGTLNPIPIHKADSLKKQEELISPNKKMPLSSEEPGRIKGWAKEPEREKKQSLLKPGRNTKESTTNKPLGNLEYFSEQYKKSSLVNTNFGLHFSPTVPLKKQFDEPSAKMRVSQIPKGSIEKGLKKSNIFASNAQENILGKPSYFGTRSLEKRKTEQERSSGLEGYQMQFKRGSQRIDRLPKLSSSQKTQDILANTRNQYKDMKPVLVLLDHDLGFLKNVFVGMRLPFRFVITRLEKFQYDMEKAIEPEEGNDERALTPSKLPNYSKILVFIKFSPRVKTQSLRRLQSLVKFEDCLVVKCLSGMESVDLNLDYENEKYTMDFRKHMEFILYLERQTFDSESVSEEAAMNLKKFVEKKVCSD